MLSTQLCRYSSQSDIEKDMAAAMIYHQHTRERHPHLLFMEHSKNHWDSASECVWGWGGGFGW